MEKSIKTFTVKKPIEKKVFREKLDAEGLTEEIKIKEKVYNDE